MAFNNHLVNQLSPYLLQHVHNPVDWYPWEKSALDKAASENKPILLSIGYSACHWCHVMAHESFEDEETAQIMNTLFVNIKVDREERPDLDKIYQTAHQLLTHNPGGWPLTVFLDPKHHIPFFTGTYFPKEAHYGLPAFKDLLKNVSDFYFKNQNAIQAQALSFTTTLQQLSAPTSAQTAKLDLQPWRYAVEQLASEYDNINGGFGEQPKFPNPIYFELLLLDAVFNRATELLKNPSFTMVQNSLTKMATGGIYDQIGGGFFRYSVDSKWEIPHFEKMLYDNAQLLYQYAQADALLPNSLFKKIITETADWVMRDMQSTEGGYFSALDADSEGKEGKYYLWEQNQVKALLNEEEYMVFSLRFNLSEKPNFEQQWHLHITHSEAEIAQESKKSLLEVTHLLDSAQKKLLAARYKRVAPGLDDKVLTSWNALMIKGMALAGARLKKSNWIDSAERALHFICEKLWKNDRLIAVYRNGAHHLAAYLDDYAFLLDAILTFLQYRWRTKYLLFAQKIAEIILAHFQDLKEGNFFCIRYARSTSLSAKNIVRQRNTCWQWRCVLCFTTLRLFTQRATLFASSRKIS